MSSRKNATVIKHPQLVARLRREREQLQQEAHQEGLDFASGWAVNAADERELRDVERSRYAAGIVLLGRVT